MAGALDVINMLSQGNLRNAAFVSEAISSGYDMASRGVAVSSNILNSITESANRFKQVQIDEWYKGESLALKEKEMNIDANFKSQQLEQQKRYYTYLENKAQEEREYQLQKTEEANKSREKIKDIEFRLKGIKQQGDLLRNRSTLVKSQIDGINKTFEIASSNPLAYAQIASPQVQAERMSQLESLNKEYNEIQFKLQDLDTKYQNFDYSGRALANGSLMADDVILDDDIQPKESLERPLGQRSSSQSLERPLGTRSPERIADPIPSSSTPSINIQKEVNEFQPARSTYTLNESLQILGPYSKKQDFDPIQIRQFVDQYGDANTVKYFEDQRKVLERQYFESQFDEIVYGKDINSSQNNPNKLARIEQRYKSLGGTPETLESLYNTARRNQKTVMSDPDNAELKVKELSDQIFNTVPVNQNVDPSTGAMVAPSGVFSFNKTKDGRIVVGDYQEPIDPRVAASLEKMQNESDTFKEVFSKVIGKNGKLTEYARAALEGLSLEDLGLSVTISIPSSDVGADSVYDPKKDTEIDNKRKHDRIKKLFNNRDAYTIATILTNKQLGRSFELSEWDYETQIIRR